MDGGRNKFHEYLGKSQRMKKKKCCLCMASLAGYANKNFNC